METQRKTARRAEPPRLRVVFADPGVGQQHEQQISVIFQEPLLSPAETARRLGVTVGTLSVWRATRRYPLRYCKVGRSVKYDARAVAEFEAARSKER